MYVVGYSAKKYNCIAPKLVQKDQTLEKESQKSKLGKKSTTDACDCVKSAYSCRLLSVWGPAVL